MNKKIIIAPLALGAVFALAATGVKDTVAVNAANDTTGWAMIGSAGTIEDTEGGISVKDAVYGSRAYKKAKVHLDGLSFTFSTTGLTDSVGDCRGFYFHNGATPWDFFTETKATVFSLWSIFTQNRFNSIYDCFLFYNNGVILYFYLIISFSCKSLHFV